MAGTFAEPWSCPARNVFPIPERALLRAGGAFPLVYQTAWRMVVTRGGRAPGRDRAHPRGEAGRGRALEIASLAGARVFVTTSGPSEGEAPAEAGADVVHRLHGSRMSDRRSAPDRKRGVDVVMDSVGEKTGYVVEVRRDRRRTDRHLRRDDGPIPKEELRLVFWKQLSILGSTMANDREFRAMLSAVAAGRLSPRIDGVFASRASQAYERLETGDQHGKIVFVPTGDAGVARWGLSRDGWPLASPGRGLSLPAPRTRAASSRRLGLFLMEDWRSPWPPAS